MYNKKLSIRLIRQMLNIRNVKMS